MLFRKKIKYALAGAFVFTLFYIFLAAVPLTNDFSFQPQWTRRIADAPRIGGGTGLPDGDAAAFMLGRTFGFFTPDGKIVRGEPEDGRFSAGGARSAAGLLLHAWREGVDHPVTGERLRLETAWPTRLWPTCPPALLDR